MKYAWIHKHRGIFKPATMFRVLGCVPQGYYQWAKRNDDDDESDRVLVAEIRDVMAESRQTYGIRRVTQALKERGFHVNHKRVERLMREHYIRCKKVKRFKSFQLLKTVFSDDSTSLNRTACGLAILRI